MSVHRMCRANTNWETDSWKKIIILRFRIYSFNLLYFYSFVSFIFPLINFFLIKGPDNNEEQKQEQKQEQKTSVKEVPKEGQLKKSQSSKSQIIVSDSDSSEELDIDGVVLNSDSDSDA